MLENPASIKNLQANTYYPARIWHQCIYNALLATIDNTQECQAITNQLLIHYLHHTLTKQVLNTALKANPATLKKINTALQQLNKHEPIQYVLGYAPFCGYNFKITPHVFIPRKETEQLVNYIIKQQHPFITHILDICTGSGCIAICLQKAYKTAKVDGLDFDAKALQIAYENAQNLGAQISWLHLNPLQDPLPARKWNLIVSNPPYITLSEKSSLSARILHYEPHHALFVPDDNPLIFYNCIAKLCKQHLVQGGFLYVEINEKQSKQLADLFKNAGFEKVQIHQDLQGKDRWIACNGHS